MNDATAKQQLATQILGEPVHQWIANHRNGGASLFAIAVRLEQATGGAVTVSPETIRQWATVAA